jgi:hypothetical protein
MKVVSNKKNIVEVDIVAIAQKDGTNVECHPVQEVKREDELSLFLR